MAQLAEHDSMIATVDLTDPRALALPPEAPRRLNHEQAWIISRHRDVQTVLRCKTIRSADPTDQLIRMDRRTGKEHPHLAAVLQGTLLFQNDERHQEARNQVRALVADAMLRYDAAEIARLARDIVACVRTDGEYDALATLADPLPNMIAAAMLGLEVDLLRRLRRLGQQVAAVWRFVPPLREYDRLEPLCAEIRAQLSQIRQNGMGFDRTFFLATAAVETTASTIASALDLLAQNEPLQDELRRDPNRIPHFMEEVMRLAGPIRRLTPRLTTEQIELDGMSIPANEAVILHVERAQRDPCVYPDPDTLNLDRGGPTLLAFGGGAHACLGMTLGRLQANALIAEILRHLHIAPATRVGRLTGDANRRQYAKLELRLSRLNGAAC